MSIKGLFADFRDYITMRPEDDVRQFVEEFDWNLIERGVRATSLPVMRHVEPAVDHSKGAEQRLVKGMGQNSANLQWLQSFTAEDFGQSFIDGYGFVELFGPRGHFASDEMSGGFFVLAPMLHCPTSRQAVQELFIPLTKGSYWQKEGGPFEEKPVGSVIVHESNEGHAIETPDAPLIALYLWRNGDLAQKPTT